MEKSQAIQPRGSSFQRFKRAAGKAFWGYVFVLPSLLIIILFKLVPLIVCFAISFTDWNLLSSPEFVGLQNYARLFTDPNTGKIFGNTFYYSLLSVPLNLAISLLLAVALNQKIKGLSFFRTAYYIPVVTASVAVSAIWVWLLSDYGIITIALKNMGIHTFNVLQNTKMP
jgi:multiple sugar transport system permease protein